MKNVNLEIIVISNVDELFSLIERKLAHHKDIQIFIEDSLFYRLIQTHKSHIIWGESVYNGFHYCDTVEKAFLMNIHDNSKYYTLQMHFAGNCIGYMQLTYFATKGILYRHYLKGMKQILIINAG